MSTIEDPRQLMIQVAKILENQNIPYMITGGVAVLVYGRPRFTADIDIVVQMLSEHAEQLEQALKGLSEIAYIDIDAMRSAIKQKGEFNFIDGDTGVKVDFWVVDESSVSYQELKRATAREVLGGKVMFISPEDLILSKLRWQKMSTSTRHTEDIQSVLAISGDRLDMDHIYEQAKKQNTSELLKKAMERPKRKV